MELSFTTRFQDLCRASTCSSLSHGITGFLPRHSKFRRCDPVSHRRLVVSSGFNEKFSFNTNRNSESLQENVGFWEDSEFLEVIGIGSRRDAVLEFCLESPFRSTYMRFWGISQEDSPKIILQQGLFGPDVTPNVMGDPLSLQSFANAIILISGAAYGSELSSAIEILRKNRSAHRLSAALIMKPFRFEGQRRQNEVMYVVDKLQEHTDFYVVIDMDKLLQKNLVTLDAALQTAKDAVVLALNAIAALLSKKHRKFLHVPYENINELKLCHIIDIMKSCKQANVGFGVGYNIKSSIMRAMYDCPFLSDITKELKGTVMCVLASSSVISKSNVNAFLLTLCQSATWPSKMVISTVEEPNLEPDLIVSTLFIFDCTGEQPPLKGSIFARLAKRIPFVFNLMKEHGKEPKSTLGNFSREHPFSLSGTNLPGPVEMPKGFFMGVRADGYDTSSEEPQELQKLFSANGVEKYALSGKDITDVEFMEEKEISSVCYDRNIEGSFFQRETHFTWNLTPGRQGGLELMNEGVGSSDSTSVLDNPTVCQLPVGVRLAEELKYCSKVPNSMEQLKEINGDFMLRSIDSGGDFDLYNSASTILKKSHPDGPKKQGILSVRAASMLESERDSGRSWSRIKEIQYQGGVYRGHCMGGLPEGKGCLSFGDGTIYDGMWRSGKRAGLGFLYYHNGDVFQGLWRDDVMHGKGWLYFHTGDRWFVNFWRGKANGEGRFYSKSGDVFFGHFRDGWRHGRFLCINVDGTRFVEIWDDGVLISRTQLDRL